MPEYAAPVALGIKVPTVQEGLAPISTMLDLRGKQQQIQQGGVQLEQSQMDLQERNALRSLSQNIKSYQTKDGGLDLPKLVGDATQVAPKLGMDWAKSIAGAHAEGIAVNRSLNAVGEERRAAIGKVVMSVADQPYQMQEKVINSVVDGNPGLKYWGDMALKHLQSAQQQGPEMVRTVAQKLALATSGVHEQIGAATPEGPVMGSGQVNQMYNVKPTAGPTGPVKGTAVQQQLPPTTPAFDTQRNAPGYLGPQKPGAQPVQSGPALGQAEGIAGTVESVNKDWSTTQAAANNASQDIGVLQNIKKYAPGAITGVTGDKRAYAEGIAGLLGINAGEIGKTSTDLLIKNSNMQALGGQTDAARVLLEGANPNVHMTKEAILKAADQVIAQRKMALEKQKFMQPYKNLNDPGTYTKALAEFNQHADPRILQLQDMTKEEKQQMMGAMSAPERAEFVKKVRRLHELGVGR